MTWGGVAAVVGISACGPPEVTKAPAVASAKPIAACRKAASDHANTTPCGRHSGAAYCAQVGRDRRCFPSPWSCSRETRLAIGTGWERADR